MIHTISYRDLTPDQRTKGARKSRQRLLGLLNNPFLSVEQRQSVYDKIALVGRWERLEIPVLGVHPKAMPATTPTLRSPEPVLALPEHVAHPPEPSALPPPPSPVVPQHHVVNVVDNVVTKEKVS